jgi:hypothetical protein
MSLGPEKAYSGPVFEICGAMKEANHNKPHRWGLFKSIVSEMTSIISMKPPNLPKI